MTSHIALVAKCSWLAAKPSFLHLAANSTVPESYTMQSACQASKVTADAVANAAEAAGDVAKLHEE